MEGEAGGLTSLTDVFERARRLGLVGPVTPEAIEAHARGFAEVGPSPALGVDLGSGAGIPGLVLAQTWPSSRWVLVEAGERRATFLEQAVRDLDLSARVEVRWGPAESTARSELRGQADLVVARSFAPPAVTAECAAGFLRVGGHVVVSEPPHDDSPRWSALPATDLGLELWRRWTTPAGTYVALTQVHLCPPRYPRRAGVPAKRPLF